MVESQVDAQMRILKMIRSEEVDKKWEGYAPDLKWKRTTISDVMILQELESVREENKTIKKQMTDMRKEQGEILGLVQQMREVIIGDNQEQNATKKEANNEPDRGNKGEEQGPQKRSANAGRKSGPTKKPKKAENPPPGSPEYANSKSSNTDAEGGWSKEEKKIKRVKTVLNADGTDIEKVPYEIPRSRYKPQKIPEPERIRRKTRDEEEKGREVIFCGIPSPGSYLKDTPFETAKLVMEACDELKTKFLGNHYGVNVKTADIAFAQRQLGHVNKKFTPITARFRKKDVAEKVIQAAKFANILNSRGTAKFGKYREPADYINEKEEVIKPKAEVVDRYNNRPGTFMKVSRTLEQQASDRAARNHRESKAYIDKQKVIAFQKEQRISQAHFEALEIPEEDTSEEEHDADQYGILPEPPEADEEEESFNTAGEMTPEEKKEAEATERLKHRTEDKKEKETTESQNNKPT